MEKLTSVLSAIGQAKTMRHTSHISKILNASPTLAYEMLNAFQQENCMSSASKIQIKQLGYARHKCVNYGMFFDKVLPLNFFFCLLTQRFFIVYVAIPWLQCGFSELEMWSCSPKKHFSKPSIKQRELIAWVIILKWRFQEIVQYPLFFETRS